MLFIPKARINFWAFLSSCKNIFGVLRNTYYVCCMKNEKRLVKTYKARGSKYRKALRRAKKENRKIAPLIEKFLDLYADGATMILVTEHGISGEINDEHNKTL